MIRCLFAVLIILSTSLSASAGNNSGYAFVNWPDTGQSACYDASGVISCPSPGQPFYGQDAQYTGYARSYTKLDASGNDLPLSSSSWSMVRDNVTGLVWEVKESKDDVQDYTNPHDADNTYTWCDTNPDTNGGHEGTCSANDTTDFISGLNSSSFGGYSDWRLPTIQELLTVADLSRNSPAIDTTYFPNTIFDTGSGSSYSSSTTAFRYYISDAWAVGFDDGYVGLQTKSQHRYVRAVRGGVSPPENENRFIYNDDRVTDTLTCLQWQRFAADITGDGNPDEMNWEDALSYSEGLSIDGHDDWRLPNINELYSLVDYSANPTIDRTTIFPDISTDIHNWSSTTEADYPVVALHIILGIGRTNSSSKTNTEYVRAVRGSKCGTSGASLLTAVAGVNGSLDASTPSPQIVDNNSATKFIFNADTGYHLAEVTGCGINYSNSNHSVSSYTALVMDIPGDCTVTASFAPNQFISVSASSTAGGSLDTSTPSPQSVFKGDVTQFTFNVDTGYHVISISGCGISYYNANQEARSYTVTTGAITSPCTVSATVSPIFSGDILLRMPPILAAANNPPSPPVPDKCEIRHKGFCYNPVTTFTGRVWLDRNLGASRVATSITDTKAYGDLYQWGRLTDGHEKRTSPTTWTRSSSDVPGHGAFILVDAIGFNWRNPPNSNLWQGVDGINNPCPPGFRVPTSTELQAERPSWRENGLRLVWAGEREFRYSGFIQYAGSGGYYHTSFEPRYPAYGHSVRCIKD